MSETRRRKKNKVSKKNHSLTHFTHTDPPNSDKQTENEKDENEKDVKNFNFKIIVLLITNKNILSERKVSKTSLLYKLTSSKACSIPFLVS